MKLEDIKEGMTLWTVLTDDPNGEPITQLIRGVVTKVGDDCWIPGYECAWKWAGGDMDWCSYEASEVFTDPKTAIEAYLADLASVLYEDASMLLKDNVVIPNGWEGPSWRGHSEYKKRDGYVTVVTE